MKNSSENTCQEILETHQVLKSQLNQHDFRTLADDDNASPIILTIELPRTISSAPIGELLFYNGYQLHYERDYLQQRNWIQIACFGDYSLVNVEKMTKLFNRAISYERRNYVTNGG